MKSAEQVRNVYVRVQMWKAIYRYIISTYDCFSLYPNHFLPEAEHSGLWLVGVSLPLKVKLGDGEDHLSNWYEGFLKILQKVGCQSCQLKVAIISTDVNHGNQ